MGSPKNSGNTAELLKPLMLELENNNCEVVYITLTDKNIKPCTGCCACQHVEGAYGCVEADDVAEIMGEILASECVVFATPIYTWFCPAPMKALLDRTFGLNKFYSKTNPKSSLWAGKKIALITTHGYEADFATTPFETGIKSLCKHSNLKYMGMFSVRDKEGLPSFQTKDAAQGAKNFAQKMANTKL